MANIIKELTNGLLWGAGVSIVAAALFGVALEKFIGPGLDLLEGKK